MSKPFKDIAVGEKFKHNNKVYTKIEHEKITCCKFFNAIEDGTNVKIGVRLQHAVEPVNNDQQ
jgi:hypothetical protein